MSNKLTCVKCHKTRAIPSFYSNRNPLLGDEMSLCKACAKEHYDVENNIEHLHNILRLLDIPFILERWNFCMNSEKPDKLGEYLRQLNSLPNWKDLHYVDSTKIDGEEVTTQHDLLLQTDPEFQDNAKFWGNKKYSQDDYEFLNEAYQELCQDRKPTTFSIKNSYKNVARTQLQAQKALEDGATTEYDRLMKTLSTLMGDANIKGSQMTGDNGIESWGEMVRKIEEQRPVLAPSGEFVDVDRLQGYVEKWFTKHFARVFGVDDSPVSEDLGEDFDVESLKKQALQQAEEEEGEI